MTPASNQDSNDPGRQKKGIILMTVFSVVVIGIGLRDLATGTATINWVTALVLDDLLGGLVATSDQFIEVTGKGAVLAGWGSILLGGSCLLGMALHHLLGFRLVAAGVSIMGMLAGAVLNFMALGLALNLS